MQCVTIIMGLQENSKGCKQVLLQRKTMSLASSLDQLSWLRLFWAWLLDNRIKWDKPEENIVDFT